MKSACILDCSLLVQHRPHVDAEFFLRGFEKTVLRPHNQLGKIADMTNVHYDAMEELVLAVSF
jgi:hypothetical protein